MPINNNSKLTINPPPKNGGVFLPFLPSFFIHRQKTHFYRTFYQFSLTYVNHFFDFFLQLNSCRLPQ